MLIKCPECNAPCPGMFKRVKLGTKRQEYPGFERFLSVFSYYRRNLGKQISAENRGIFARKCRNNVGTN